MSESKETIVLQSGAGTLTGPYQHDGMAEPSDAVFFTGSTGKTEFLVVNDNDNQLRVYRAEEDGPPLDVEVPDLDALLGSPKGKRKADLEAMAALDGRIYIVGSHSRNSDGENKAARQTFFAISDHRAGQEPPFERIQGTKPRSLIAALSEPSLGLADAIRSDIEELKDLAPEQRGLNIEGLAVAPDAKSLLIGLRNPLSPDDSHKARVLRLSDPAGVVDGTAEPKIEPYAELDLGGRGIRSMAWLPGRQQCLVIAGPNGSGKPFALYVWSGFAKDAAMPWVEFDASSGLPADFHPESIGLDPDGHRIHLLSDDGDRILEGVKKPGEPLKDQPSEDHRFRSYVFVPTGW